MDAHGFDELLAVNDDPGMATRPLLDLSAGYVQRSIHELPKQGSSSPWSMATSYAEDVEHLRRGPLEDPALRFARGASATALLRGERPGALAEIA